MNHTRSKCRYFKTGIVFNEDCTKVVGHVFCEIDEMEDDKPCTENGCRYYTRNEKNKESEATNVE